MPEKLTETEAMKQVLDEDPNTRGDSRFAKNLAVIKTMQKLGIPIYVPFQYLKGFSIDSLLKLRRDLLRDDIGKKNFKYQDEFVPEENVSYEKPEEQVA